jgi:hypothetical protein
MTDFLQTLELLRSAVARDEDIGYVFRPYPHHIHGLVSEALAAATPGDVREHGEPSFGRLLIGHALRLASVALREGSDLPLASAVRAAAIGAGLDDERDALRVMAPIEASATALGFDMASVAATMRTEGWVREAEFIDDWVSRPPDMRSLASMGYVKVDGFPRYAPSGDQPTEADMRAIHAAWLKSQGASKNR